MVVRIGGKHDSCPGFIEVPAHSYVYSFGEDNQPDGLFREGGKEPEQYKKRASLDLLQTAVHALKQVVSLGAGRTHPHIYLATNALSKSICDAKD